MIPYNGGAVPSGYHLEEHSRRGPVIGGTVLLSTMYGLGLTVASFGNFPNSSGYLVVPVLGPWITLAARHQTQFCSAPPSSSSGSGFNDYCVSDDENNSVRTLLVIDGLAQAAGAALLIYGIAAPKKVLVRDFVGNLRFAPAQMGKTGFGGFVMGTF